VPIASTIHADLPERRAHQPAGVLDEHHQERQRDERQQREPPVDQQHDHDDAEHLEDVGDQRDRALREHLVEALDVVRHPRHQAADRDAIEERGALREHVVEDRAAHRVHRALARELEEPGLAEAGAALRDDEPHVRERVERQHVDVAGQDVRGQRVPEQRRLRELERDRERHEDRPRDEQLPVRSHERPHPPHQREVVRLAEARLLAGDRGPLRWRAGRARRVRGAGDGGHHDASFAGVTSVSSCVR